MDITRILHKRSNVVTQQNPKAPTANDIVYGELAVNYADGYETLFIKNSNNDIVSISSDEKFISDNGSLLLPTVSSTDNGKILRVVNGQWELVNPVSLYTGSGTPSSSQGNNGDIYVQTT